VDADPGHAAVNVLPCSAGARYVTGLPAPFAAGKYRLSSCPWNPFP
jgi:hypothetical protein